MFSIEGDKCFDIRFGWGVVRSIELGKNYPVTVAFFQDVMEYTTDGKSDKEDNVSMLRHYEYKLCEIGKK